MPKVTIDDRVIDVPDGATILATAKQANIYIPTLCDHPDQDPKGNCRMCMVEVDGSRLLQPACAAQVWDGMVVHTNSAKVRQVRSTVLELIVAHHPLNCIYCYRNGLCELQTVAQNLNYTKEPRFERAVHAGDADMSSPSIVRDPSKCIVCGRCEFVCSHIQTVHALAKDGRGFTTVIKPDFGKMLGETVCVNCGQCVQVCPVAAIRVHDDTGAVWDAIADPANKVVAQVAPAVRITVAEALGEEPGTVSTGRLVTALKGMGIDTVFDTDVTADLTIMEEGTELIGRLTNGGVLPMITSCCPGWIKFAETFYPELLPNLSSCKSPQGMFGALIKTFYADKLGVAPDDLFSLSVMPCTAKKFEALRPELGRDGRADVDKVITVQELAHMIKSSGINFATLPETDFDDPFGLGTGAGEIFGATGGVMEAALRTVYEVVTGQPLEKIDFVDCRGFAGIKEASVQMGEMTVKVAVAHGLGNARKLMDAVKRGETDYHFIEIMACPGGCIGGGGNPIKDWNKMEQRFDAVYATDVELPIRKSHENPAVGALYEQFLDEPNSHLAHELLHTHYQDRSALLD
ncbi:MAG: NADH-dependent [FeFe] hydrogenase, group A6 [Propionibacteriaceae bacterium]|nr:NADH-dependent [FeFe] hydrogenase, group A6 [Propionibacteriaceae bacterium]